MTVAANESAPAEPSEAEPSRAVLPQRLDDLLARLPRALFLEAAPASAQEPMPSEGLLKKGLAALMLKGDDRILEVGSSTGYETALLSQLAGEVISLAPSAECADLRARLMKAAGCGNVTLVVGPGGAGWPMAAPYTAIFVASGATQIPAALLDQLALDGRLVIPLGDASGQLLELVRRRHDGFTSETLACCRLAMLPWASRRPSSFPWRREG